MNSPEEVTLTVTALRELVRRADTGQFVVNVPYQGSDVRRFQHVIRITPTYTNPLSLHIEEVDNGITVASIIVPIDDLFNVHKRVEQMLSILEKKYGA